MNFRTLRLRLRSLFLRHQVESELTEELRFHLEAKAAELRSQGIAPADALARAQRDFGNLTLLKDQCRDRRRLNILEALVQDLRYSARGLARSPGVALVCIASLALGIGATSALFSIFDVALLHPIDIPHADRLAWFEEHRRDGQESGGNPKRLHDWQTLPAFQSVAGYYTEAAVLTQNGAATRIEALRYAGPASQVFQASTQLGRLPSETEAQNGDLVVVLTHSAWRKYFAADPNILDKPLRLSGKSWTVVGVLAPAARYPEAVDFWAPMPREVFNATREAGFLAQAARLAPDASLQQAQTQANVLAARLALDHPATDAGRSLRLGPLAEHVAQPARVSILLFLAASFAVLLIACVNVAGLLLARGLNRRREAAIRVALGAGRTRLIRLFMAESLLLAFAGSCAGLLLASLGLDALKLALPEDTPRLADAVIGWRAVLFGVTLALASAILCGLIPAWRAAVHASATGMKEGGRAGTGSSYLRSALVIAQMALSLTLLITGGLLVNSFLRMRQAPLGFQPQHAAGFSLALPWDTPSAVIDTTTQQVLERLAAAPGTWSAGVVDRLPLHGGTQSRPILVDGLDLAPDYRDKEISWRMASPGFFPAAGIPLIDGVLFRPFQKDGPRECLITQQLARDLFPDRNPIGQRIASRPRHNAPPEWFQIAGVTGNTRLNPADSAPAPEVYVPWGADYWPILNFVVRGAQAPSDLSRFVDRQIRPLLPGQIIDPIESLNDLTAQTHSALRTRAILAGTLALTSLLLCALGLFALLAHETARRTREYGIRVALGAQPPELAAAAIRHGLALSAAGLALGLAAALTVARTLQSLLFEVKVTDAATCAEACLILVTMALLASAVPALRAARTDPIAALRHN